MNKEVYKHIISTYGRQPAVWIALLAEGTRAFIGRIITVMLLAQLVASVSVGDFDSAQDIIIVWVVITVAAVMAGLADLNALWAENHEYEDLMLKYYKKLTNKDMMFFRNNHAGYLTAMFRQYLDSSLILVRMIRGDLLRTAISLTFPAIVMLFTAWQVGVVAVVLIVVQGSYMMWVSKKAYIYREKSHEVYREISGEVADDITNIVAYKSAGREKEALARIEKLRRVETDAFWMRRKIPILLNLPRSIFTTVLVGLAFWFALEANDSVEQTVATLVLTITYMFQILRNLEDLPDLIFRHDDLVTKMAPTLEILKDNDEKIRDPQKPKKLNSKQADIEIRNASFSYQDGAQTTDVFNNFNLKIANGEKVGVVGLSGAGKSTLASLLMRFDELNQGEILIGGTRIQDVRQSELRAFIAYVPQEPLLFHRSVRANIAYHDAKASDSDVHKAAKAAHAHEFIQELPNKYDTVVGERGVKLSGGQKQRVVIARAVLKKAPILLFDEATSALDSESEHIIQTALPEIIGSHTAIVIAHRLSTVAQLDRIIVMHNGEIVEEGTHQELLKKKGRYHALWQRQVSGKEN